MTKIGKGIIALLLLISAEGYGQQTGKIDTDRPDQTESTFIIPRNYFQAELGFNKENYRYDNYLLKHPTALMKYGLSNRLELRLEMNYITEYLQLIPDPKTTTFLEPVEIGTKVRLWEEKGLLPKASVIAHIGLPFLASEQFQSDPASYTLRFSFQNSLTENLALGYNFGIEGGGGEDRAFFYTIAPGIELGEKWYSYVEAFGSFYPGFAEHYLDGGIAYYLSPDTKLDLSGGFGLGDASIRNYVAIGFSFRMPLKK